MKVACLFILATILASASAMTKMMPPAPAPARDSLLGTYAVKVVDKKANRVIATASAALADSSTVFVDWTVNSLANLVSIELATATGAPIAKVFSSAAPVSITGKAASKAWLDVSKVPGGAKAPMDNKGVVLLIRTLAGNYSGVLLKEGKSRTFIRFYQTPNGR